MADAPATPPRPDLPLTGGCFCGALAYEIHEALLGAQSCHCSRCRKVFSGYLCGLPRRDAGLGRG